MLGACVTADQAPVATIKLSSATAGSSLGGRLVEGVMTFRGYDYLLTLRGVEQSARSVGSVRGLVKSRDIAGTYKPSDDGGLHNAAGVTIHFDPPLVVGANGLEIELMSRRSPKVSTGNRESGVE
jgi:hypothetical protein